MLFGTQGRSRRLKHFFYKQETGSPKESFSVSIIAQAYTWSDRGKIQTQMCLMSWLLYIVRFIVCMYACMNVSIEKIWWISKQNIFSKFRPNKHSQLLALYWIPDSMNWMPFHKALNISESCFPHIYKEDYSNLFEGHWNNYMWQCR